MDLSADDKWHYLKLEKGYQGEVMFDKLTALLDNDLLIINDLCLEFNNSSFQIDTLIIAQDTLYPFEVKNYDGDFVYEADNFLKLPKKDILNPLDQLKRSKTLLQQLLRSYGFHFQLEGHVVFVNPEFALFQAPVNVPIILPNQLNRFIKKLNQTPSKLNSRHKKLGETLISLHQPLSRHTKLPSYKYERTNKGVICPTDYSFMIYDGNKKVSCGMCGCEESADSAILRGVEEIRLLFPDKKITTNHVFEWGGMIGSKKMIGRILKQNYQLKGYGQWTFYE
jgi:hypothetical protein